MTDKTEWEFRDDIIEVARLLDRKGLVAATDGNISVRLPDGRFLLTPSGVPKGKVHHDQLILVDGEGSPVASAGSATGKPTSEFRMHLEAYRVRPDVLAVVHAHPVTVTAFTIAGLSLAQCVIPEVVVTLGAVPTSRYATPSSEQGPEVIREFIGDCDAIILDRHGAITVGKTVFEAYYKMEKLEHAAEITLKARQLGKVKTLPPEEVRRLMELRQKLGVTSRIRLCNECYACGGPPGASPR